VQLYWWRKISVVSSFIISGMSGHLSRTTNVALATMAKVKKNDKI
jgi:hypothetical protein